VKPPDPLIPVAITCQQKARFMSMKLCFAAWLVPAVAPPAQAQVEQVEQVDMTIPDAGRLRTTAEIENGILGISNSCTRFKGTARECVGACF
jgi:hypothetical protein